MKKIFSFLLVFIMSVSCTGISIGAYADASDEMHSVVASLEHCSIDGSEVTALVSFEKLEASGIIYAGIYTSAGILRQIKQYELLKGSADITISFTEESLASNDSIRIFFVDKNNIVKPLGKAIKHDLQSARLSGFVSGTSIIGEMCESNQVIYSICDVYGNSDWEDYYYDNEYDGYAEYTFYVADGVNADDYFGIATEILVEPYGNGYIITSIKAAEGYDIVELSLSDIDVDETTDSQLCYYPLSSSLNTSTLKLDNDAVIIANYEDYTDYGLTTALNDFNGDVEITVIENTGDTKYDLVMLKAYTYGIIDYVEADKGRFATTSGTTYTFDFEDNEITNKIVNKDGKAITLADFAENDVVAVISEDGQKKDFVWIEVINLGNNTVEGAVTEIDNDIVYIDYTEYKVIGTSPLLGDEGIFYLTKTGKIFFFELSSAVFGNYGYILQTGLEDSGFSEVWKLKILTEDEGIVVYDADSKFTIDGVTYENDNADIEILTQLAEYDYKELCESRLVKYELNDSGYIEKIYSVDTVSLGGSAEYNSATQSIDKKMLEDDTVIFNITPDRVNRCFKTDISNLVDEELYSGYIAANNDGEYDCLVLLSGTFVSPELPEPELLDEEYGYILRTALNDSGLDEAWQIKLLTENNGIVVYNVYDGFDVNGTTYTCDSLEIELLKLFTESSDYRDNSAARLVSYKLNSDGYIREINSVGTASVTQKVYNSAMCSIGENILESDTVIFNLTNSADDILYKTDISALSDGISYTGILAINTEGNYDCFVIFEGMDAIADEETELHEEEYGYILHAALNDTGFSEMWQIKLLTENDGIVDYDVHDRFRVNDIAYTCDTADVEILSAAASSDDYKAFCTNRLISYRLNSDNCIEEINSVDAEFLENTEYNADTNSIGDKSLEDDAVIFNIDKISEGNVCKADITALINGGQYSGAAGKNENDEYDCFVIVADACPIDTASDIAVVEKVTSIIYDSYEAIKVNYYISEETELKEVIVINDEDFSKPYWGTDISDIEAGCLMMLAADSEGVASGYAVLANVNGNNTWTLNENAIAEIITDDDDNEFVVGPILNYESKTSGKVITYSDSETLTIKTFANKYTVDNTKRTLSIEVSDWEGGNVDVAYDGEATYFFARLYNGVVNDFVTIGERTLIE